MRKHRGRIVIDNDDKHGKLHSVIDKDIMAIWLPVLAILPHSKFVIEEEFWAIRSHLDDDKSVQLVGAYWSNGRLLLI